MAKIIQLTQGYSAIVDDEDFERVNDFKWYANKTRNGLMYARRTIVFPRINGKQPQIKQHLHRFILGIEDRNIFVDFKDDNPLNCQKENLIISNSACKTHYITPRKKNKEDKGVRKHFNKWNARIKGENGKEKFLGSFDKKEDAINAYKNAMNEMIEKKGGKII